MYYLVYSLFWLLTLPPLRLLYLISDLLYPVIYYIIGYRKLVVRNNLKNSFPEKTIKERRLIERQFYRFFCDLFVETMKAMHFSDAELKKRMTYENVEGILEQHAKQKSVMIMTGHYGNWEWTIGFPLYLPDNHNSSPVYQKQTSKEFDQLIHNLRSKFGAELIERKELLRVMFQWKKENKLGKFWMFSDQSPVGAGIHFWTQFLHQDTTVITGTEQLARKFDYPVFYADITRLKRGYYHCKFIPISLDPTNEKENAITEKYIQLLEKRIQENPPYWLWSHKRWKYQRT